MTHSLARRIAPRIAAAEKQVLAAITLMDEGATVPFIARYRKEATGGLNDNQLRELENQLHSLRELDSRRATILRSIEEQGQLSDALREAIEQAETRTALEDLYLPYKPRRRTRAQKAREAGLEPLLQALLEQLPADPLKLAAEFVQDEGEFSEVQRCLDGARHIFIEQISEHAGILGQARETLWQTGVVVSTALGEDRQKQARFRDYLDYQEAIRAIPSHRALALFRGRAEGVLDLQLALPDDPEGARMQGMILSELDLSDAARQHPWVAESARQAWRFRLHMHLTVELFSRLREGAEDEAIRVFGSNLRDLLLSPPAGQQVTLGIDPGIRTGIKLAVVDGTGKLLHAGTAYPHPPKNQWDETLAQLEQLCRRHDVQLVAIGNGTASRETEKLVAELATRLKDQPIRHLLVSEAGASVYSASALAAEEFPELDVSLRGAVSIARRLQDPLAELVKIPPQSIGVGQYQHDVNQVKLGQRLGQVVEDCVNQVGVQLNTASAPLLARVAGLSPSLAENIVRHREQNGPFRRREQLLEVPMLGPKKYQQCAGFLRIRDGEQPLDATAVHPEAYPLVENLLRQLNQPLEAVLGNTALLRKLKAEDFVTESFGLPTVRDVLAELEKPGLDPRGEFRTARFADGVEKPADLKTGQWLEGVVTNVTNFGAFVDIGVHQDGLVHISQLADRFVKDPRDVVKAGQIVRVRVLEVDLERQRIALSMKNEADTAPARQAKGKPGQKARNPRENRRKDGGNPRGREPARAQSDSALGSALADALKKARS